MITRIFYKEVIGDIKDFKEYTPYYLKDDPDIIEERSVETFKLLILIIFTPLILVVDLIALPFELIYLILYKVIWKEK